MKYKIGDKIIILPSAYTEGTCSTFAIGMIGIIKYIYACTGRLRLYEENGNYIGRVAPRFVKPFRKSGEQLLFAFMED